MNGLLYIITILLNKYINHIFIKQNIIYICFINKAHVPSILNLVKTSVFLQFTQLLDLWVVDLNVKDNRFQINYFLNSIFLNTRIILRTTVSETTGVYTASTIYSSANWLERECYDMFGVLFYNHPDLRRILTDYGFEGYPLRKDFPLTGYLEVRFDDELNRVVFEPVVVTQEYRYFEYISPWEHQK